MTRQQQLDLGTIAASNLAECLSVNFTTLLGTISPKAIIPVWDKGITRKMRQFAEAVGAAEGIESYRQLQLSPSDTVRGAAALLAMLPPDEPVSERLDRIRPFADDPHFGVREWAWMAIRPHLSANLQDSIQLLREWTHSTSPNIRRFAVEATRPRGVWCAHIDALKQQPQIGLCLLEPLKADEEKYVQDSVSNWLNDAAKSQPDWVRQLCQRWLGESPNKATARIAKRAQRSL